MQGFETLNGLNGASHNSANRAHSAHNLKSNSNYQSQVYVQELILKAPVSGVLVPLSQVPDPVFSQNGVGEGVSIDPTGEEVVAPCDATVLHLHSAGHAIVLKAKNGLEILIHIGLDTVKLKGQGFTPLVKPGMEVTEGQSLIRFDADLIAQRAKSLLTEIVLTHSDRIQHLAVIPSCGSGTTVRARDALIRVLATRDPAALDAALGGVLGPVLKSEPIQIHNSTGLHARPAATLAALAKKFRSDISLRKGAQSTNGEKTANARSLVGILGLEIEHGDYLRVEAQGDDAAAAMQAVTAALQSGLGESSESEASRVAHSKPALPNSLNSSPALSPSLPSSPSQNHLRGVMASPGRAVGKVFQIKSQDIPVREEGESEAQETERLNHAIYEAKFQLETIASLLKKEADSSRALIFSAHQELLDDPGLLDLARRQLAKGKSAAYAWKEAYTENADQLSALNNQLLAARATDVRDVGQRVLRLLQEVQAPILQFPDRCILVSEDLTPSDVAGLDRDRVLGIVTTTGGSTSHVAILARSLDIPALAGMDRRVLHVESGTVAVLDASNGELRLHPTAGELKRIEEEKAVHDSRRKVEQSHAQECAKTQDGRAVEIVANLKGSKECANALEMGAEGVGLLRTEFLFMNRDSAPTEEEQLVSYLAIAQAFGKDRPVIIRTLDVGGDKPLRYLPLPREDNPFLGERGLRVSLNRPDVFRTQLRAILRAAQAGDVRVMFPMVSTLHELRQAKAILEEERVKLNAKSIPVGIMVEVPSVAILADQFAKESDFFSIGSNDLAQYTLAIDRGHPKLAAQVDGLDPSLLRLIDSSVRAAHAQGKWVGVCGGIASDPQAVPFLLGLGVDELSVSVPAIPAIKALIRSLSQKECEKLAARALNADSAEELRSWVK